MPPEFISRARQVLKVPPRNAPPPPAAEWAPVGEAEPEPLTPAQREGLHVASALARGEGRPPAPAYGGYHFSGSPGGSGA